MPQAKRKGFTVVPQKFMGRPDPGNGLRNRKACFSPAPKSSPRATTPAGEGPVAPPWAFQISAIRSELRIAAIADKGEWNPCWGGSESFKLDGVGRAKGKKWNGFFLGESRPSSNEIPLFLLRAKPRKKKAGKKNWP